MSIFFKDIEMREIDLTFRSQIVDQIIADPCSDNLIILIEINLNNDRYTELTKVSWSITPFSLN